MSCCRQNDGLTRALDAVLEKAEALTAEGRDDEAQKLLTAMVRHLEGGSREAVPQPHGPQASDPKVAAALRRYYDNCMKEGTYKGRPDEKKICSQVAWSIYCTHKNPSYPGCTAKGRDLGKK
jgi:hypothetical protein